MHRHTSSSRFDAGGTNLSGAVAGVGAQAGEPGDEDSTCHLIGAALLVGAFGDSGLEAATHSYATGQYDEAIAADGARYSCRRGANEMGGPGDAVLIVPLRLPPGLEALRRRLVPGATEGLSAHATVVPSFLKPEDIDEAVRSRLRRVISAHHAFSCRLVGQDVPGSEGTWRPVPQSAP